MWVDYNNYHNIYNHDIHDDYHNYHNNYDNYNYNNNYDHDNNDKHYNTNVVRGVFRDWNVGCRLSRMPKYDSAWSYMSKVDGAESQSTLDK